MKNKLLIVTMLVTLIVGGLRPVGFSAQRRHDLGARGERTDRPSPSKKLPRSMVSAMKRIGPTRLRWKSNVAGGANMGESVVTLKSVYTEDSVYFLVSWEDPTQSFLRSPWEMQADGSWLKLKDPDDVGGDNNVYYEDKFAFIWPINDSIPGFAQLGCFAACHAGENSDVKPFGNKYLAEEGQLGDIWHWKSIRNLNQIHDQYLDHTQYSADTPEAGRHGDPKDSGGYVDNVNEDKTGPAFMGPEGSPDRRHPRLPAGQRKGRD